MNLLTCEGNRQVALEPGFSIHGMYMLQFPIRLVAFLQETGDSPRVGESAGWVTCGTMVCS